MGGWTGDAVAGLEVFFQLGVGVLGGGFCVKIGFEHVVWPSEIGGQCFGGDWALHLRRSMIFS
jgi:hypothetical protein